MGLKIQTYKAKQNQKTVFTEAMFLKPLKEKLKYFWFIIRPKIFSPLMHPYNTVYEIVKRFGGD